MTIALVVPDVLHATDKWVGILWGCFGAGVFLVWGLGASIFINYVVALLQEHTEPRMMGRVMSTYTLVFFVSMPLGYAQAGLLTSAFGPQTALVASGSIAAAIGLACLALLRPVRALP